MPRSFNVPPHYRSGAITALKQLRRDGDPRKRDLRPTVVDFGPVRFKVARHFGFCFGVENAIEIAYRAIEENPGKRLFLLSEMIHNPGVNADLEARGVRFLMNTDGSQRILLDELLADDIVIVPAFGTTLEIQRALAERGIDPYYYDTTCPFVEKVWKRAEDLGSKGYTIIVHGKRAHEETRATFSHSKAHTPTLVVLDKEEALFVISYMKGDIAVEAFAERMREGMSEGFDPATHLKKVGVVNQTTMLATDTQEIAALFRTFMIEHYGEESLKEHYADTRDTLCYATYENQNATRALIENGADLSLVVGGYNSSNTSHLVELCAEAMPTYYIKDADEILSRSEIRCFNLEQKAVQTSNDWLPDGVVEIAITAGASCPDRAVDDVIARVVSFYPESRPFDQALQSAAQHYNAP